MCSSSFAATFSGQAVAEVCASSLLGRLSRRTEICAECGLAGVDGGEDVARTSRTDGEGEAKGEEAGGKADGEAEDLGMEGSGVGEENMPGSGLEVSTDLL